MIPKLLDSDFFSKSGQSIAIEPREPQAVYPEHTHNFNEFVIVTKGAGWHIQNGNLVELYPGMMFYVDATDHHLYENVRDLHLVNILFKTPDKFKYIRGIEEFLPQTGEPHPYFFIDKKCDEDIQSILLMLNQNDDLHEAYRESLFLQLLILFQKSKYVTKGSGSTEDRVRQLLRYLQVNYKEQFDWAELTAKFSLSLRSFHRHVQKMIGITPQRYLIKLRLADAYYKLCYSDDSISTIAQDCGFNDGSHFSTSFKSEFNVTPKELRKN